VTEQEYLEVERDIILLIESSPLKNPSEKMGPSLAAFFSMWVNRTTPPMEKFWRDHDNFTVVRSRDRVEHHEVEGQVAVIIAGITEAIDNVTARIKKMRNMNAACVLVFVPRIPVRADQRKLADACDAVFCVNSLVSERRAGVMDSRVHVLRACISEVSEVPTSRAA